ncbi:PDC sensor domain-containing protein [Cryobacterium tagatosivorans]|uniref:Cache domain-containing protein n=1 Tax=Cryobacterium tagatosivorans TaxID=1259199 RepID=A0A4R8UCM3_9MICO|nr:PDC sensor domain-containing protein [Cryobacterium tagatosivorans]TFB46477.1 hypothetical protein E3O23_16935 [Cryobacterium tagatosivorans]
MDALTRTSIADSIAAVSEHVSSVFLRLEDWRGVVQDFVRSRGGEVNRAELDSVVEGLVLREFARPHGSVIGAGFVSAPGFLRDAEWHLAWWLGDRNTFGVGSAAPSVRRLDAVEDSTDENFRDYTALEWWRVPVGTGTRHITGPYVDYLCTDDYTLTLTLPVCFDETVVGVVGADLYVEDVERALLPRLAAVGAPVTLVNASGRVVLSTDVHLATGALLRLAGLAETLRGGDDTAAAVRLDDGHEVVWCPGTGLALVVRPARR